MQDSDPRSPLRLPVSFRAKALASTAPAALVVYGIPADVADECERVAKELRLGFVEVKHLHAACGAIKTHAKAMIVASTKIRPWDRQVLEEHAGRADMPIRWVADEAFADDVAGEARSWAKDALRRARPSR